MANENEGVQTQATTTEPTKYLDKDGLKTFWGKVKALVTAAVGTIGGFTVNGKPISTNPVLNKADIGLGNVDNTSDAAKPVSTAQATAIAEAKKAGTDAATALTAHKNDKANPHGVTKAQVGLGNVDNVKQIPSSEKGKANGVATLDANGKVPLAQLGNLDTSLYIIPADNKLPTTDIKTNKIYLIKETSGTNNVYTEYIYVNNAWEILGKFKADVDLTPYAKLDGGNTFTGTQTVTDKEADTSFTNIAPHRIKLGSDMGTMTITENGITTTDESDNLVFNTNGGTVDMDDYVAKTTYNTDKKAMTDELGKKLPLTGGTINGNLAVTGSLTKGGKAVLTDHQAIYNLTVQKNGTSVGTFNPKSANATINVTVPTKLSELSDDVVKGKYLPLTGGGKIVDSKDSAFYTKIEGGDIIVGINDVGNDTTNILINRSGITLRDGTTNIGSATQAFATNGGKINMTDYATTNAMNTELKKYLPLAGGTMTGLVTFTYNGVANRIMFDPSAGKVGAQSFVKANATAKQLLCGDGTVAERIDETEIAAICV